MDVILVTNSLSFTYDCVTVRVSSELQSMGISFILICPVKCHFSHRSVSWLYLAVKTTVRHKKGPGADV